MNNLTAEMISQRLQDSYQRGADSDGYAEIPHNPDLALKCAAVLIPLMRCGGEWHVLFTRRTDRVESHKGQVSFPGGACDEGETTPEQTALREAEEEIGLQPSHVRVLGRLHPMITISHFRVTPVVGEIPFPYAFKISGFEVARVFTVPLLWLADRRNFWEFARSPNLSVVVYQPYDGEIVWGATGRMTVNFLRAIGYGVTT